MFLLVLPTLEISLSPTFPSPCFSYFSRVCQRINILTLSLEQSMSEVFLLLKGCLQVSYKLEHYMQTY